MLSLVYIKDSILSASLQELIEDAGYSRHKFAERFGTSSSAVYKWCNGTHLPTLLTVYRIAELLQHHPYIVINALMKNRKLGD